LGLPLVVLAVGIRHAHLGCVGLRDHSLAVNGIELHKARNVNDGQGVQKHGIYHSEDGGICPDAECHGNNTDDGEAGALVHRAQAEVEILR